MVAGNNAGSLNDTRGQTLLSGAALLTYISDASSGRLTGGQIAFFLVAAACDLRGKPASRIEIINAVDQNPSSSLASSYRVFLGPGRTHPHGLGWLRTEVDPQDSRQRFMRLTDTGLKIARGCILVGAGSVTFN